MSKTMTTTKQSLIQLTQSIQLKDTITFQINTEVNYSYKAVIKSKFFNFQQMQNDMGRQKAQKQSFNKLFQTLQTRVKQNQKFIHEHDTKIKQLQNNIGDDFMKKLYDIQTRIKNTFDFDQTVRRLEQMNKFVLTGRFNEQQTKINQITGEINNLKDQLNRYVQNISFDQFKDSQAHQLQAIKEQINKLNQNNNSITDSIIKIQSQCSTAVSQVKQNSKMIKQMNFNQLMDKIKKMKQDSDQKVGQLSIKLKKKCALTDLSDLQNTIIEKLDKFLSTNQKGKATTNETKQALIYLEKRLNEIYQILVSKQHDQQNDALFSAKKIHCASCTKDLGKFEGRLGQFRPWAVFPCKQLDPQKTGGLGYLTYVDKMHQRRGSVTDDASLERLNKTFNEKMRQEESPRKMNTTRTTNFMSSFGEESNTKQLVSLKDEYFKQIKSDKTSANKFFRVKKDAMKPTTALQSVREKVKEI